MTSSLVGSEMCIRDRNQETKQKAFNHHHHNHYHLNHHYYHQEQGQGPVSYTHLTLPTICSV
eukprot:9403301-Prorocentrum_lima.AAC.1